MMGGSRARRQKQLHLSSRQCFRKRYSVRINAPLPPPPTDRVQHGGRSLASSPSGMVYLEACSRHCSLAPTMTPRIARPEKYDSGRIKASLEGGNDQIERWVEVGAAMKPSNIACKVYCGVDGFGAGNISEDPANTVCVVYVCFRRVSRFRTATRSPPRSAHGPFCTSRVEIGSNARSYLRIPWTRLCLAFPRVRSMRRNRTMAWWAIPRHIRLMLDLTLESEIPQD